MGFLESVEEIETRTIIEGLIILVVAILAVAFIYMVCCQAKKSSDKRRRKKEEEEASEFFSFHEALPDSHPKQPGPLTALYHSAVFSLSGSSAYPGHPYATVPQTTPIGIHPPPMGGSMEKGGVFGGGATILEQGQHMSTPIYPPSYFSSAPYDQGPPPASVNAPPPTPPPPYQKH